MRRCFSASASISRPGCLLIEIPASMHARLDSTPSHQNTVLLIEILSDNRLIHQIQCNNRSGAPSSAAISSDILIEKALAILCAFLVSVGLRTGMMIRAVLMAALHRATSKFKDTCSQSSATEQHQVTLTRHYWADIAPHIQMQLLKTKNPACSRDKDSISLMLIRCKTVLWSALK